MGLEDSNMTSTGDTKKKDNMTALTKKYRARMHKKRRELALRYCLADTFDRSSSELPRDIALQLYSLCDKADKAIIDNQYTLAVDTIYAAISLIPSPKENYVEMDWLNTALGNAYFLSKQYYEAVVAYERAYYGKHKLFQENTNVLFRMAECYFELDKKTSFKFMEKAYKIAGNSIFEFEDRKYAQFFKRMSAGGSAVA